MRQKVNGKCSAEISFDVGLSIKYLTGNSEQRRPTNVNSVILMPRCSPYDSKWCKLIMMNIVPIIEICDDGTLFESARDHHMLLCFTRDRYTVGLNTGGKHLIMSAFQPHNVILFSPPKMPVSHDDRGHCSRPKQHFK